MIGRQLRAVPATWFALARDVTELRQARVNRRLSIGYSDNERLPATSSRQQFYTYIFHPEDGSFPLVCRTL